MEGINVPDWNQHLAYVCFVATARNQIHQLVSSF
jgi:hypothetical protein